MSTRRLRRSGGELFQDVNSASKAFGELVESVASHTVAQRPGGSGAHRQPAGGGDPSTPALR
ncbi:hypothetical protein BHS30_28965 [Klebsiella pneumoniae]|nr:hypothetical protein BHS30_28965 [Klebsiella pneumoniae]